jgi:O-antigen ligase
MTTRESGLEVVAFVLLAAGLGVIQFTIFGEDVLALSALLMLAMAIVWRERARFDLPAFFTPLLVLAAISLVSCAFSSDPLYSLARSKQLLLFLVVPLTARLARGGRAATVMNVIIAFGSIAALIGIVQYAMLGYDDTEHRPRGLLGHYMTYSGVLMLITCAAVARLAYRTREWVWPAIAVPALLVALSLTYTRSAWVGSILAITMLLAMRNKRLLLAIPALVVMAALLAPAGIRQRATSMFDMNDPANRDRRAMLTAGIHMIKDHPLLGVGMNMVPRVYLQYRTADAVDRAGAAGPETRSHLHNVPLQIAAERGLPALGAWIWFVVIAGRDLWRQTARGPARAIAAAGLATLVAMLAAGLFEHNFGDSEFLILFLGLLTLPYAASRDRDGRPIAA